MSRPRYPKTDANANQIADDLDASSWPHMRLDVSSLPVRLAGGDWFIGGHSLKHHGFRWLLVEIKQPGAELTPSEQEIYGAVMQLDGDYLIAECAEDILRWFGRI